MSRLAHRRVAFLIPPTGAFCREDRCQSFFRFELIPTMRPPMEECEAAGALRSIGAEVAIVDAPAERLAPMATLDRLLQWAPDLVVVVVTFGSLTDDLAWAGRVRAALPGVTIGIRGAPCYVQAERILADCPEADFCVRGEYEVVFRELARSGHAGVAGFVHRDHDGAVVSLPAAGPVQDLDALPRPYRGAIDPRRYTVRGLGVPQATVRVQRGCPYPCSYCLVHTVSGDVARHRSPGSVADEIAEVQRSGVSYFYLRADTFSLNRAWTLATCEAIARECPGARWVTTTRVERVDDEVLDAMRRAGCYGVSFGVDVGSRSIGERVGKLPAPGRARQAMRLCDRHGILSLGYFMIGFVWETRETLAETAAFVRDVRPDLLTIHYAHPYPGTRYHAQVQAAGAAVVSGHSQAEPALADAVVSGALLKRHARLMSARHYATPAVALTLARKLAGLGFAHVVGGVRRGGPPVPLAPVAPPRRPT